MIIIGCKNRLISSLALVFFSIPTFSAEGHVYLGGSLAASFAQLGHNSPHISYISGDKITDAYPLNKNNTSTALFSVNGGYEFNHTPTKSAVALGLGVYSNLADYHYNGQLIETAAGDASSTLYNYTYHVNSTRLMAEVQLNWMLAKLSPFLNFGLGSAWNRMSDYHEKAVNNTGYVVLSPFHSQTNVNFAYQAGFGVSTMFHFANAKSDVPQERISLGYRYANLGTTSFGTRGSAYPHRLNTGLLQTNDVYLSYTHLF